MTPGHVHGPEPSNPSLPSKNASGPDPTFGITREDTLGAWPTGTVLASLAILTSPAGAETVVRARVLDHGGTGPNIVRDAERIVDRVYARSGVMFAWRNCDPARDPATDDCAGPTGPNDVSIRIADREPRAGNPRSDIQGGCAIPLKQWTASGIVYVYSDRVRWVARDGEVPEALVLGTIVAHEIGHLLLPSGHTSRGIMRGLMTRTEWILAEQGRLGFTPLQSHALKARGAGILLNAKDFDGGSLGATAYSHGGQNGWD